MAVTATVGSMLVGGYSAYSADKNAKDARKDQRASQQRANEMEDKALALEAERVAKWENTYGDIEANLSHYYNNLDPNDYRLEGFDKVREHTAALKTTIKKRFGAQGVSGSDAEKLALTQLELSDSRDIATIDREADKVTAREQASFLSLGLREKAGNESAQTRGIRSSANAAYARETQSQSAANSYANQRDSAIGGLLGDGLDILGNQLGAKPASTPVPGNTMYDDLRNGV